MCIILLRCSETSSKAERTLDESKDCCYECVDRACQTRAAQIQEGSQVGKRQVLAWRNVIGQIEPGRVQDALTERLLLQRGAEACALLTMRIQRSAMKRAITDDLHAWLGKLAGEANEAGAKGDMGRVFAVAKKLKSGHDRLHRVIRDEDGVLLVDEEQVTARWRRHWAELLHGQETKWSELANVASEHAKQHTGRKRMDLLMLHDVQSSQSDKPQRRSHFSGRRKQRTNIVGTAQHHSGDGQIGGGHAWWSRARALQKQR